MRERRREEVEGFVLVIIARVCMCVCVCKLRVCFGLGWMWNNAREGRCVYRLGIPILVFELAIKHVWDLNTYDFTILNSWLSFQRTWKTFVVPEILAAYGMMIERCWLSTTEKGMDACYL